LSKQASLVCGICFAGWWLRCSHALQVRDRMTQMRIDFEAATAAGDAATAAAAAIAAERERELQVTTMASCSSAGGGGAE
jgi:hypothetical protein